VFAVDGAAAIVQNAFLVLAEPVVVLIGGRVKDAPTRKVFSPFTVCGAISQPLISRTRSPPGLRTVRDTGGSDGAK
jgi:hypothetical protein